MWLSRPPLRELYGDARGARRLVAAVEAGRARSAPGARPRASTPGTARRRTSSSPPRRRRTARARAPSTGEDVVALTPPQTRARCDSPVFRGGVAVARRARPCSPRGSAFGLRERAARRAACGSSSARACAALRDGAGGVLAETAGGRVRAGAAVVAVGAARGGAARRCATGSRSPRATSCCTEPVPDVIEALGWTGGEAITDGRALLHYFRTTPRRADPVRLGRRADGGGRADRRPRWRSTPRSSRRRGATSCASSRRSTAGGSTHAWGGPIDVSPTHLPAIVALPGGRAWAAFGYTGNGVGPSHLVGRALAALALDRRDAATRLPLRRPAAARVPPEPLRVAGAAAIRARARAQGGGRGGRRPPDPVARALAAAAGAAGAAHRALTPRRRLGGGHRDRHRSGRGADRAPRILQGQMTLADG